MTINTQKELKMDIINGVWIHDIYDCVGLWFNQVIMTG